MEDILRVQAWHHPSLGTLLKSEGGQPCKMESLYFRFTPIQVSWLAGEMRNKVQFQGVLLMWPRNPGCLVMLKLATLYKVMGLNQFGGQQWRWVNSGFAPWKKALSALGLESHLLASHNMKVFVLLLSAVTMSACMSVSLCVTLSLFVC